jgi:hypothetical protein
VTPLDIARECGAEDCFGNGIPGHAHSYMLTEAQLTAFAARIRSDAMEEAGRALEIIEWLEQHHWDKDELFSLINDWRTPDGKRHPEGLRAAIDAAIRTQSGDKT